MSPMFLFVVFSNFFFHCFYSWECREQALLGTTKEILSLRHWNNRAKTTYEEFLPFWSCPDSMTRWFPIIQVCAECGSPNPQWASSIRHASHYHITLHLIHLNFTPFHSNHTFETMSTVDDVFLQSLLASPSAISARVCIAALVSTSGLTLLHLDSSSFLISFFLFLIPHSSFLIFALRQLC